MVGEINPRDFVKHVGCQVTCYVAHICCSNSPVTPVSPPPRRPKAALVYNCTTGGINPFHWGEIGKFS